MISITKLIKNVLLSEATKVSNWEAILKDNEMLRSGIELVKQIENLGGEAYIVGGAARDIMMGTKIKDVDIATNVSMDKIKANFKWNAIGQSQDFGIIMVHYNGEEFEVASFRSEAGSSNARHPDSVQMVSSFQTDSERRDFTINSMGINSEGTLVDYQNGMEDLKKKMIKAVGNPKLRFEEDALRILRALRFAVRYGFDIEPETKNAMIELRQLIRKLSAERISDELMKVSSSGTQLASYIEHLDSVGLLEIIIPELKALQGKNHNPVHHPEGDAFHHTMAALRKSNTSNPISNIAIAFHDLGKGTVVSKPKNGHPTYHGHEKESGEIIENIAKRLKWSSKLKEAVQFAANNHMKGHIMKSLSKKNLYNLVHDPNWEILKDLMYADHMARGDVSDADIIDKIEYAEKIVHDMDSSATGTESMRAAMQKKINGNLVMKVTGLKPGTELGKVIGEVQDWIFEIGIEKATDEAIVNKIKEVYANMQNQGT